jgi:DNA-binding transcriptional LysR family regulator
MFGPLFMKEAKQRYFTGPLIDLRWCSFMFDGKVWNMSFKNKTPNWDDLRLFLAVAQAGGLVGAAATSGSSSPTLSRRMRHLEDTLDVQLFDRTPTGYDLTFHGRDLLSRVQEMDGQSKSIQTWLSQLDERPVVRVTAGFWTSVFLARHLREISVGSTGPRIELLTGANFLNLSRREADIAVRNKVPDIQGLAKKRIGRVSFAIYGSVEYCASHPDAFADSRYTSCDWVLPSVAGGTGTSSFWLRQRIGGRAALTCDSPQAVLEATAAGVGLCILPVFIGSLEPRLQQCSLPIESIEHTQWLVKHQDDGNLAHVRKVFRKIETLFELHKASFY